MTRLLFLATLLIASSAAMADDALTFVVTPPTGNRAEACDATLFSYLETRVAVLQAKCAVPVHGVQWFDGNVPLTGPITLPGPMSEQIYLVTNPVSLGAHQFAVVGHTFLFGERSTLIVGAD